MFTGTHVHKTLKIQTFMNVLVTHLLLNHRNVSGTSRIVGRNGGVIFIDSKKKPYIDTMNLI